MDNCVLSLVDGAGNVNSIEITIEHIHNFVDGICDSCGASEYEEIELTKDNLYMTGLVSDSKDFDSLSGSVIIPDKFEYNGQKYKTTSVDFSTNYISYGYSNVTNLFLPDSILSIKGLRLFYNIESFNIPKNVTTIIDNIYSGNNTRLFTEMPNLKTITYSSKSFIPKTSDDLIFHSIISNCKIIFDENVENIPCIFDSFNNSGSSSTKVSEIEIRNPNATIANFAFCSMKSLTHIVLPNNLKEIGKWTFANCTSLTSIELPENLTVIGEDAFSFCIGLNELTVPNGVTSIGSSAFYRVPHITYHGSAKGSPWDAVAIN